MVRGGGEGEEEEVSESLWCCVERNRSISLRASRSSAPNGELWMRATVFSCEVRGGREEDGH